MLTSIARGAGAGIGVQIQAEPGSGKVVLISTIAGGPAANAGLKPGDQILFVDGESVAGMPAELVAARMRGDPNTKLSLVLQRPADGKVQKLNQDLTRAAVKVSPVTANKVSVPNTEQSIAIIRLPNFTQETVKQAVEALREVTPGTDAIAIDLRGNAGGYMPAGVDMAKLFLPTNVSLLCMCVCILWVEIHPTVCQLFCSINQVNIAFLVLTMKLLLTGARLKSFQKCQGRGLRLTILVKA